MEPRNQIEQITKDLLAKMDFQGSVEVDFAQEDFSIIKIESEEAGLLIGQKGENLAALQHLVRAVASKKISPKPPRFIVDINNYRLQRLEFLKDMALAWAGQVAETGEEKILGPLSPYERRVVHITLSNFEGVKTESQGEGFEKIIIIKPSNEFLPNA